MTISATLEPLEATLLGAPDIPLTMRGAHFRASVPAIINYKLLRADMNGWGKAVGKVVEAIDHDPGAPLEIDDMARIACFSKFHFTRMFNAVIGVSPGRYLMFKRVVYAQMLLVKTPYAITAITHQCGYTSIGTFSSRFSDTVGISPTAYRRVYRLIVPAKELLATTHANLPTIAILAGYTSVPYFIAHFTYHVGISPLAYRRRHTGGAPEGDTLACPHCPTHWSGATANIMEAAAQHRPRCVRRFNRRYLGLVSA